MGGRFETYRDRVGQYRFRLCADSGEILLTSRSYPSKDEVREGIDAVRANVMDPGRFERSETSADGFRWVLTEADTGEILGASEGYTSPTGRDNGIAAAGLAASGAEVVDLTKD